ALLVCVSLLSTPARLWFYWPLLGWGRPGRPRPDRLRPAPATVAPRLVGLPGFGPPNNLLLPPRPRHRSSAARSVRTFSAPTRSTSALNASPSSRRRVTGPLPAGCRTGGSCRGVGSTFAGSGFLAAGLLAFFCCCLFLMMSAR